MIKLKNAVDKNGRIRIATEEEDAPIFLFATGERCGSTLLQRCFMSHPMMFMWGEQHGFLEQISIAFNELNEHCGNHGYVSRLYGRHGCDEFIANLSPAGISAFRGFRAALRVIYGGFAPRWGVKEVRCGVQSIKFLQQMFPEARFVLLTRDIKSCVESVLRWGYSPAQSLEVIKRWVTLTNDFRTAESEVALRCIFLKYEEFIAEPENHLARLAEFCRLDLALFDRGVLQMRIADHSQIESVNSPCPRDNATISSDVEQLLATDSVRHARKALGYVH